MGNKVFTSGEPVRLSLLVENTARGAGILGEHGLSWCFQGGDFFCGTGGSVRDELQDDQSLFFRTDVGVVVVLGCAHSGVIHTLEYVGALTGERIHAVVGGMHLLHADEARMRFTVEELRRIGPDWLAPNHCTGDAAVARLWQAFPGQVFEMHAGQTVTFPRQNPQPGALHHG